MFEFLREIFFYIRERKRLWMLPIIIALVLVGSILVVAQGSAVAPFIYTLF
jgi:hypothetical protein